MSSTIAAEQYTRAMSALTAAREGQMPDECTVTRPVSLPQTPELDAGGNVAPGQAAPPVYEGPCTVSDPTSSQAARQGTPSDEAGVPSARVLKVPHRAALQPGDVLTVTASAYSPGLVGDTFVVSAEEERSYATYRRFLLRGSSWQPSTEPES